jgi:hypothetical protein
MYPSYSKLRRLSEPPENRSNLSLHQGKGRAFVTEVIGKGPSGGNPEGNPDDPGNDKPPQDNSGSGNPEDLNDLTDDALVRRVFVSLAKPCQANARAKVNEPDAHHGSNQAKPQTFFLQCMLNFRDRLSAFKTGSAKVQYPISYLTGMAFQYCEPTDFTPSCLARRLGTVQSQTRIQLWSVQQCRD